MCLVIHLIVKNIHRGIVFGYPQNGSDFFPFPRGGKAITVRDPM